MSAPPLSAARRVVILWTGRLGDILVSTPFLDGLRRAVPGARIGLITAEAGEGGARLLDCVDEVGVVRKGRRVLANAALVPFLGRTTDLLIDMNSAPSGTSTALARLSRAKAKAAFARGRGDGAFDLLAEAPGEREHMLARYERLAALLGFSCAPRMRVPVPEADAAKAKRALRVLHEGRLPVALFAGNFKKKENRWAEDRFAALADRLADQRDLAPYWLAGPGELERVEAAAALAAARLPVLGPFSLGVTAGILGQSALYVGNCTGTSHLAVCAGTPTFTVLAGYTAAVWAPPAAPPHWRAVSADWESCREVGVEEAWKALQPALAFCRSAKRA
ncbi:MAG: glycosyltransferase family 9 protein [Elusimicrobia bacterium]|nr:glycosyltransferase family 9 protein [Elusimicrobiota bacterium]